MAEYTEGIVLHLSRFSDRAYILHTYTRSHGRMQYLVYGLHNKKGNIPPAAVEPLSLIGMETSDSLSGQRMPTLKQAHLLYSSAHLQPDIRRKTVALFLAEVLTRSLHLPMEDTDLFDYLRQLIRYLDTTPSPENIHLLFMLQFAHYLGFTPTLEEDGEILDMQLGEMLSLRPQHDDFFTEAETSLLRQLESDHTLSISRTTRQQLLRKLCRYYELHIDGFQTPKSLDVLEEIFD